MSRRTNRRSRVSRPARQPARAQQGRVVNERRGGALARLLVLALFAVSLATGVALGARGFEPLAGHFFPPALAVERVAVAGAVNAPVHEIARALDLRAGTPLLSIDRSELARRVTSHPWVRDARVVVLRPGLVLTLVEEREVAAVAVLGSPPSRWLVDSDGTPFLPASSAMEAGRVAIVGLTDASPAVADARLREGVAIARALERHGLTEIGEVQLGGRPPAELPALRIGVGRQRGTSVLLGSGDLDPKLARLAALLRASFDEVDRASVIDLRFGDRMVLRSGPPEGEGEAADTGGRPSTSWTRSTGEAADRNQRG